MRRWWAMANIHEPSTTVLRNKNAMGFTHVLQDWRFSLVKWGNKRMKPAWLGTHPWLQALSTGSFFTNLDFCLSKVSNANVNVCLPFLPWPHVNIFFYFFFLAAVGVLNKQKMRDMTAFFYSDVKIGKHRVSYPIRHSHAPNGLWNSHDSQFIQTNTE